MGFWGPNCMKLYFRLILFCLSLYAVLACNNSQGINGSLSSAISDGPSDFTDHLTVTVTPKPALHHLQIGAQYVFYATVTNANNPAVTWSVSPSGCGSVGSTKIVGDQTSAVYTARATHTNPCTIRATSMQDSTHSDTSTIFIDPQLVVTGCNLAIIGSQQTCHTSWAGLPRTFVTYIPTTYHAGDAVVLSVHPLGPNGSAWCQNPPTFPNNWSSGTEAMADTHGFAAVCPDDSGQVLPGCSQDCWDNYMLKSHVDDAGFLNAVTQYMEGGLAALSKRPDPRKIYMFGFSSGAKALMIAANEYGDTFAAAVPYESSFYDYGTGTRLTTAVPPQSWPISTLLIRGNGSCTNYNNCPAPASGYNDGTLFTSNLDDFFAHFSETTNTHPYVGTHIANPPPPSGPLSVGNGDAACTAVDHPAASFGTGVLQTIAHDFFRQTYPDVYEKKATGCAYGVETQVLKLMGGQHWWYGTIPLANSNCLGNSNPPCNPYLNNTTGLSLCDIVWNFLAAHPKR